MSLSTTLIHHRLPHPPFWIVGAAAALAAVWLASQAPAWVLMWTIAISLYFGFKWLTLTAFFNSGQSFDRRRVLAYLLAWPGMDTHSFLSAAPPANRPKLYDWTLAGVKTLAGAGLFWGVAPLAAPHSELLTGWLGMIGLVLLLHFGLFHLIALAWQASGVDARPLMNAPLLANSVTDVWSRRWNRAFRDLAHQHLFRPLSPHWGAAGAMAAVFLASGLIHDLAISVPARGGFGLPTAYFLLQGAAVFTERAKPVQAFRRRHPLLGRACAWAIVGGAAFWLFHPPFVTEVVLPMMRDLGAI